MWILDFRHEALTPIFKALTFCGEATFFLLVFTVGYWVLDRRIFARATLVMLGALFLNSLLKAIFQVPRPDASLMLVEAHGWSFPSGHAMAAGAVWPWLAYESKRRWAMPAAILLAFGVAASRVYLGVHTLWDVSWGLLLGALLLPVAAAWRDEAPGFWQRLSCGSQTLYLAVVVVLTLAVCPVYDGDTTGAKVGGALVTLWWGLAWDRRRGHALPTSAGTKVLAAGLGLAGTFGLRFFTKATLGASPLDPLWIDFLRYAVLGLWIAAGACASFYALGLARPEIQDA